MTVLLAGTAAFALPTQYRVPQFHHTEWRARDGVPTGIEAIAQTPDGFLWLGTSGGLFRFDGVSFERFSGVAGVEILSQDITALHVDGDGELWIGHHLGGVSRLRQGRLINYGVPEGLPRSTVSSFSRAGDGAMWAGTTRGPFRLEGGRWVAGGKTWHAPADPVDGLVLDRDRTLWMMGSDQVFHLRKGASRFEPLPLVVPRSNYNTLLRHPDGRAMVCSSGNLRTLALTGSLDPEPRRPQWVTHDLATPGDRRCAFDRQGQLWVGQAKGAARVPPTGQGAGPAEYIPLSGNSVSAILEDREGNLWFANRGGLDRFRAPALMALPLDVGAFEFALAPAGGDEVWIGSSRGNIFRFQPASVAGAPAAEPRQIDFGQLAGKGLDTLFSGRSGTLWLAGGDSLWRRKADGSWQRWPRTAAGAQAAFTYSSIQTMTEDAQGGMWVSVLRAGVYHVVDGVWTLRGGRADLPGHNVTALFTDARDRIWFGYDDGAVLVLDGDRLSQVTTPAKGGAAAAIGTIEAIAEQGGQVWIGSAKGLWRWTGETVQPVAGSRGPFIGVTGLASTPSGDLWLSTMEGVIRIGADELSQAALAPEHRVRHELLNHLDGLPGVPDRILAQGGRLWVSTSNGVVWLDPSAWPRNAVAPVPVVSSVVADGSVHALAPGEVLRLKPRTRDLTLAFTAPSLTMPERVRFRYRLGDARAQWQDAGTHREISFRDLAPGIYRFDVEAANNDGVWSGASEAIRFEIPPTFVQTAWFKALCATAAIAVLWLLLTLRVRTVRHRLRLRMEERLVERERIARELHDTLLQEVQGLVLHFDAAVSQIAPAERERGFLREALDHADRVIADGRDAVTNLRAATGPSTDLARELRMLGERWSRDTGMAFEMRIDGPATRIDPTALQECHRIVAEAMSNAFRHSRGSRVEFTIDYSRRSLALIVADDGRGFDPQRTHDGHWGLVGMRERAQRLNARLSLSSGKQGSTLRLEVPARIAYQPRGRSWLDSLVRRRRLAECV